MSLTFVQVAGGVGRKVLIAVALSLIGLIVGFACVLLPPAFPFGIVGVAALLLLWVIPELNTVPDRWARRMVPIMLVVLTCVPVYYAIILPGIPWIQIRRAFLIAWLVPMIIVIAGSSAARERIVTVLRAAPWLASVTLGFMAITLITLPTAVYFGVSVNNITTSYINFFLPMFGVILFAREPKDLALLFKVGLAAAAVDFVLGAIETPMHRPFLFYALPPYMRQQIIEGNPIARSIIYGTALRAGVYRAQSAYTSPLSWGENSAMFLPFGLHFLAHGKNVAQKWLGLAGALVCFLSIVLAGSRGGYVSMITSCICFSICWSLRSSLFNKGSLAGRMGLMLYATATVAVVLAIIFVPQVHRVTVGDEAGQASTDSRAAEWELAKPKIMARPILGYGAGAAGDVIHYPTSMGGFSVDGYHMNMLVDYGVPGFLLFFGTFFLAAAICFRLYTTNPSATTTFGNALGASVIAFVTYRWTLSQVDSLPTIYMIIGLVFTYIYMVRSETADAVRRAGQWARGFAPAQRRSVGVVQGSAAVTTADTTG